MQDGSNGLMAFLPFVLIMIMVAVMCSFMAKNKGLSAKKHLFLGLIPFFGYFLPFLILSKTDQNILNRLEEIERKLNN